MCSLGRSLHEVTMTTLKQFNSRKSSETSSLQPSTSTRPTQSSKAYEKIHEPLASASKQEKDPALSKPTAREADNDILDTWLRDLNLDFDEDPTPPSDSDSHYSPPPDSELVAASNKIYTDEEIIATNSASFRPFAQSSPLFALSFAPVNMNTSHKISPSITANASSSAGRLNSATDPVSSRDRRGTYPSRDREQ